METAGLIWRPLLGICKHNNDFSSSIKGCNFGTTETISCSNSPMIGLLFRADTPTSKPSSNTTSTFAILLHTDCEIKPEGVHHGVPRSPTQTVIPAGWLASSPDRGTLPNVRLNTESLFRTQILRGPHLKVFSVFSEPYSFPPDRSHFNIKSFKTVSSMQLINRR